MSDFDAGMIAGEILVAGIVGLVLLTGTLASRAGYRGLHRNYPPSADNRRLPQGGSVLSRSRLLPQGESVLGDSTPRCQVCGWPLADALENGCIPGNCSMRPVPKRNA